MADQMGIELTNGPQIQRVLEQLGADVADGRPVLRQLDRLTRLDMTHQMNNAKATGGTVRGKKWDGFADQYTRATDGVTVPAWGGVPKLHGPGTVKGRKRRNGRVKSTSKINADTGAFKGAILAGKSPARLSLDGNTLYIGGKGFLPKYAKYIMALRPLFFWTRKDRNNFRRLSIAHIREAVAKAKRRAAK